MSVKSTERPKPTFHPVRNMLGTLTLPATAAGMVSFAVFGHHPDVLHWAIQVLLVEAGLVMAFAAPKVPRIQLAILVGLILVIHGLFEFLADQSGVPLQFLVDHIVEFICVSVAGAYWVSNGYIPRSANSWE